MFEINREKCIGCGLCVQLCPYKAIEIRHDKRAEINQDLCQSCGRCVEACQMKAIEEK